MSKPRGGRPRSLRQIVRPQRRRRGWCSVRTILFVLLFMAALAALPAVIASIVPVEDTFQQVVPTMGIMQP